MPSPITVSKPPTADSVVLTPDQPTRREPVYSRDFVDSVIARSERDRERLINSYSHRIAQAHYAIRMALSALEIGDVERAVRHLRRGGA